MNENIDKKEVSLVGLTRKEIKDKQPMIIKNLGHINLSNTAASFKGINLLMAGAIRND